MAVGTLTCASSNFRHGRPSPLVPEAVVLHRTGGTRAAFEARFRNPSSFVSTHYVVGRDGSIDRCVRDNDTAFHAGLVGGSAWPLLRPNVNPNFYTIGIEFE